MRLRTSILNPANSRQLAMDATRDKDQVGSQRAIALAIVYLADVIRENPGKQG